MESFAIGLQVEVVEPETPDPSSFSPDWAFPGALRAEGLNGLTRGTEAAGNFSQGQGVCLHQFLLVSLRRKYSEWGFQAILLYSLHWLCKATHGLLPEAARISPQLGQSQVHKEKEKEFMSMYI